MEQARGAAADLSDPAERSSVDAEWASDRLIEIASSDGTIAKRSKWSSNALL